MSSDFFAFWRKLLIFFIFFIKISDMNIMEGLTINEIAKELGLDKPRTAEKRLQIAGIKPISRKALYPLDSVEKIRNWPSVGKPPKKPKDKPEK
jgi:hypothetical protein